MSLYHFSYLFKFLLGSYFTSSVSKLNQQHKDRNRRASVFKQVCWKRSFKIILNNVDPIRPAHYMVHPHINDLCTILNNEYRKFGFNIKQMKLQ